MNDRKMLEGPAFHEAGHVLAIYAICGNLESVDSSKIDSINENDPPNYEYGGNTELLEEPQKVSDSIKELSAFKEFGVDFIMACYYFGGGVAEMIMMNQKQLNEKSMEYDIAKFESRNIENSDKLRALAISFCERNFSKMKPYLQAIAEKLIETSARDAGGIEMGLGKYELLSIVECVEITN